MTDSKDAQQAQEGAEKGAEAQASPQAQQAQSEPSRAPQRGGKSRKAVDPATVRVKAHQNLTIGGSFVAANTEGDVPACGELYDCVNAGLVELV